MKLSVLATILATVGITSAAAIPSQSDSLDANAAESDVVRGIEMVHTSIMRLKQEISARQYWPRQGDLRGSEDFVRRLLDHNRNIVTEVRRADDGIRRSRENIKLIDTFDLQTRHLQPLKSDTDIVVQGWLDVKPIVTYARLNNMVEDSLVEVSRSTSGFSDAVITKLPASSTFFGQLGRQQFSSSLDRAIAAYRR